MEEPLEEYLEAFEESSGVAEELLETSIDLADLEGQALEILSQPQLLEATRYLAGPFISADDLRTLVEARSITPKRLAADPGLVRRIVETVLIGLDRRRFPWVMENRDPTEAERHAAIVATASLMATRKVGTNRRSTEKHRQEDKVEGALLGAGMTKVPTRAVATLEDAPGLGEFCRESLLGNRKADFIIRLHDRRVMAVECKVSNSETNSIKRLNNDAAAKAVSWRRDFGEKQVVPTAVLSGVYKLRSLVDAQVRGLTLFWSHALGDFIAWVEETKTSSSA